MKKFVLLFLAFSIFIITGCEDDSSKGGGFFSFISSTKKFWALNRNTETFYQLTADRLAENSRCEVWVEKGSGVTAAMAKKIADEYANNIYQKMINNFGWTDNIPLTNGQSIRMNTFEFAHALATGRSGAKLTILLLDIKDDYSPGVNESYVAGYFIYLDFLSNSDLPQGSGYKSNELDMIYIDTYPGLNSEDGIKEAYTTLAHETQHLMNFVSSINYRVKDAGEAQKINLMDLWIDEGLSSAAEYVYSNSHSPLRVGWFYYNGDNDGIKGKIDEGNNFYVWGNRVTETDPYPVLDDYATVYLFFQWLRLQSNVGIYKEIIKSTDYDYNAVIKAFNKTKSTGANYTTWEAMLTDWLKANIINSASGRNGYENDRTLKTVKAPYAPTTSTTLSLYPGEGVYSYSDDDPNISNVEHIKYEYLPTEKTLLTYNANTVNSVSEDTDISTLTENGSTTGVKPPANIVMLGNKSIKLGSSKILGPFPVGINDKIRKTNTLNFEGLTIERVLSDE